MAALAEVDPPVTADDLEEDVSTLAATVEEFYAQEAVEADPWPPGLDVALRSIFEDHKEASAAPASALIARLERDLAADIYRWTGHFPERTRALVRYLARRARELGLVYPEAREASTIVALTTLVTTLAMNRVHRGSYVL